MAEEASHDAAAEDFARLLGGTAYRYVSFLASGATGDVVEAEHVARGVRAAVKILRHDETRRTPAERARAEDRMRLEAEACARLDHPNLVPVLDFGVTATGRPFLVSERLFGRTLGGELAERGALPVGEAVDIVVCVLAGLAAAHEAGIVHRDLKPDNVFLTDAAAGARRGVKVLDFGLAKVIEARRDPAAPAPLVIGTDTGTSVGTPRFMAPEQAAARRNVDGRADVYGVGALLYTMITGRGPFDHHRGVFQIMTAHESEAPRPPSFYAAQQVPSELDRALLRALEKDPSSRFQTASDLARAIEPHGASAHHGSRSIS